MSPKWFSVLSETLSKNPKAQIYACATIDVGDVPRVRHIAHRSFLATDSSHPLLVACTDIRTPKVHQVVSTSGSVSEIAWWIEDAGEQFRITAHTHFVPHRDHPLHSRFPFDRLTPRGVSSEDKIGWWEKERIDTFDNKLGGALRASFCRPTPGSPLDGGYESAKEWPAKLPRSTEAVPESKEAEQVTEALNNFALLVFEPIKLEQVELSIVPNRRTSWQWDGDQWAETILVP